MHVPLTGDGGDLSTQDALAAVHAVGVTYRMLDYWARSGRLDVPSAGHGRPRRWPRSEIRCAWIVGRLIGAGLTLEAAFTVARHHEDRHRLAELLTTVGSQADAAV